MNKYIGIQSDQYYLKKEDFDEMGDMLGVKVGPVDLNAACVWEKPENGDKKVDLSEIQYNIHERFGLKSVDDFNSDYGEKDEGGDY